MIKTEKLTRVYQSGTAEIKAIDNVSLQVRKGEFLAITGRSGSGKSTLLYQLGLLDFPSHGSIHINDINVLKLSNDERTRFRLKELGYVFQDYAILPSLSALENVMLPLLMQGDSKKEAIRKATKALERVGLGDRINNLPSQLSGGQQQRVSIARAIGHEPSIIFADEPTANLDSETSKAVLEAFLELHRDGQTIIMVTHEKDLAVLGDRVIELKDGQIIADNKPQN
jgi:putative ABC transport system ATP-binding protein